MIDRSKKLQARFYVSAGGRRPVREWLLDLSEDDRREFGWPIGMPYCPALGDGLWETRSDLSSGRIARVIFTIVEGEMALLHGFVKKTRKTPAQELELARKRLKEIR